MIRSPNSNQILSFTTHLPFLRLPLVVQDHTPPPQFIYLGNNHQCAVNLNAPQNSAQCAVDALAADVILEKAARVRDERVDGGIPRGRRTCLTASRVIS